MNDDTQESQESGTSIRVGGLDGVAALDGAGSFGKSSYLSVVVIWTRPVLHWLAGSVAVGAGVAVTVTVLVGGGGLPPGVAAARIATVAKIASLENIVKNVSGRGF